MPNQSQEQISTPQEAIKNRMLQAKEHHLKDEMRRLALELSKAEKIDLTNMKPAQKMKLLEMEAEDAALIERMRELADEEWEVEGLSLCILFAVASI